VFMAQDGLLFYIFYELALIPIYFICAIWGGDHRIRITLKFFIYTFIGSLFMLLSLLYVYLQTPGAHSFAWPDLVAVPLSAEAAWWVMLGFFLAFAVKMPLFPFHTWQPDTYVTAPTGGTMLLAGIMLKMGIYGVVRWMVPLAPEALHAWTPVFLSLAVIGIVYASIIAVKQTDLKRLIAYSSIAHVGLIAAGVLSWNKAGVQGSMIQMLNHGINVVGLFFVADLIERRLGTRSLSDMGGIARNAPHLAALFMIIMLGSVAVPLTNGFVGEFLLLNGVWNYSNWMGFVAGLTIIFGAVYMLRAYGLAMFGPANQQTEAFADVRPREYVVLGIIAALVLLLGFFPQIILDITNESVNRILGAVQQ
jgi:NADH-quinone oxidoreductase subunit M